MEGRHVGKVCGSGGETCGKGSGGETCGEVEGRRVKGSGGETCVEVEGEVEGRGDV